MPRLWKLYLFISAVFILFSFSYLWLKQCNLQTKLYDDDKDKFLFLENLRNKDTNDTKNQVEQPEKHLPILSPNLDTISEKEKDLANFIKRFKQKYQSSTIRTPSKLVPKPQSPEI